jgi:hypothetical protein
MRYTVLVRVHTHGASGVLRHGTGLHSTARMAPRQQQQQACTTACQLQSRGYTTPVSWFIAALNWVSWKAGFAAQPSGRVPLILFLSTRMLRGSGRLPHAAGSVPLKLFIPRSRARRAVRFAQPAVKLPDSELFRKMTDASLRGVASAGPHSCYHVGPE